MKSRPVFPSRALFDRARKSGLGISFVLARPCRQSARALFEPLARTSRRPLLLESSRTGSETGRFSFMLWDPFAVFQSKGLRWSYRFASTTGRGRVGQGPVSGTGDPLTALRRIARTRRTAPGNPLPFSGGPAGLFAYELKDRFEKLRFKVRDPWKLPDIDLGFYDRGLALDHAKGELCAFRAFSSAELKRRTYAECVEETRRVYDALEAFKASQQGASASKSGGLPRRLGSSDAARRRFMRAVVRIREHIRKGDVYQVNLSQVIELAFVGDAYGLYLRQAQMNPTSFAAYADFGDYRLVSASPERLVRVDGTHVSTRPIAGTRPRSRDPRKDRDLTAELLLSPKERAEHVMLVDLERNDLGRVCRPGSVRVDELMAVEKYSHVKHIVSNVTGELKADADAWDVIRAVFPGGTITGAPKIRAMEIIAKLEGRVRGPYTGSLGYVGFDGNCDLNIVIRTLWTRGRKAWLQAGAGIVADSDPRKEYEETLHKAAAFLDCLGLGRSKAH
jgi:para-aminobenzoate synthetase component 1